MKNILLDNVPELTKISSKGQLVIPKDIRENLHIKEGDVFATTNTDTMIILKKIKNPMTKEDLLILKEVEEAWKEIERGECETMDSDKFLEELEKWTKE